MFPVACTNEQKVPITVTPRTSSGRPASIDGPVRVTVTAGDGTVEGPTAENPLAFAVVSGDAPGVTSYLLEADADLGEGTTLIQETIELTVTSETAQSFGLVAGAPEPKVAAEPPAEPSARRR